MTHNVGFENLFNTSLQAKQYRKMHCGFKHFASMSLTSIHPFKLALVDTYFVQLDICFTISQTVFPCRLYSTWQISVLLLMHALTRICTCSPRIMRQLISSIGCEILGAPVRCFQFRVTTVWESLCDIRAWDRKRCREFSRIKWTLAHEVVKKAGNATGNASVGV